MKKAINNFILLTTLLSSQSFASTKAEKLYERLVPFGKQTATWQSNCILSMKSTIKVNKDKTFDMTLKAYSSINCEEGTDYITLSRNGKYKYQGAKYETVYWGNGHSYQHQVSPRQLKLKLSSVRLDSKGTFGLLGEQLLSMYKGCVEPSFENEKSRECKHSGISKTTSRIKLSNMKFITPTKMLAQFRNDVNVELTLVK